MTTVPNWQTRERLEALESANERLTAEKAEALAERDRARNTAVALEQDGAMAHKALLILADAVLAEVDRNTAVYSKALAVKRIGGKA